MGASWGDRLGRGMGRERETRERKTEREKGERD